LSAPGATRFDFRGTGRETDLQLVRLNDGVTVEEFTTAAARTRNPTRLQSLGSFAGGDKHRYRFTVVLDASAGNAHQGDNGSVVFDWTAS